MINREKKDACPLCGESVGCGVVAGKDRCWCFDLPPSAAKPEGLSGSSCSSKSCLCKSCLKMLKEAERLSHPV